MLITVTPPRGHQGCIDCGHPWEPEEGALIDRHGGPYALACVDRDACEERQRQKERPWDLRLGDCLDPVTGLASLPALSVDHSITDPPYEQEVHSQGRRIRSGSFAAEAGGERQIVEKPISYPPITEAERREVGRQLARVVRRWILVFCQVEAAHLWKAALEAGGAEYVRTGSWHKTDARRSRASCRARRRPAPLSGEAPFRFQLPLTPASAARPAGARRASLGGAASGLPRGLDGHWPAGPGEAQYEWEASRTAQGVPNRPARLKALGNAVVPQVGYVIGCVVQALEGHP